VGLENLAFAFGMDDVENQGQFLEELLAPVDGFLVLDLHNLYCQSVNFAIPALELLKSYPLERVKQLHVSGGSWSQSKYGFDRTPIRRDTHDDGVPEDVLALVEPVARLCPNASTVVFERLGTALETDEAQKTFVSDFKRLRLLVDSIEPMESESRSSKISDSPPSRVERTRQEAFSESGSGTGGTSGSDQQFDSLAETQGEMLEVLSKDMTPQMVLEHLRRSELCCHYLDYIETWEPRMIEVAQELVGKWGRRT
jgi:hypothetical protein